MKPLIIILSLFLSLNGFGQKSPKLKKQILGFWMPKDEPEGIHISKDSIFYVANSKSYKYTLTKEDTLIMYFEGSTDKYKILMPSGDSMVMIYTDSKRTYFVRSK